MSSSPISTYLNDHLGGAIAGEELLENIASAYAGTGIEPTLREVHQEVVEDRHELQRLMTSLDASQSMTRKAAGWLAEKAAQLKLRVSDPKTGPLRLLESLDAALAGVEGKRLLWLALSTAAANNAALRLLDYPTLIARAESQRRRLEPLRLEAARRALTDAS
jgi:hypothetical protein